MLPAFMARWSRSARWRTGRRAGRRPHAVAIDCALGVAGARCWRSRCSSAPAMIYACLRFLAGVGHAADARRTTRCSACASGFTLATALRGAGRRRSWSAFCAGWAARARPRWRRVGRARLAAAQRAA
ncbi:MAG: hypothetical protein MZV65_33230 [Chromatiales bacterium]|nr:hypothetical protein [Chromatiales bacterium]